jgi:hypothetical protein
MAAPTCRAAARWRARAGALALAALLDCGPSERERCMADADAAAQARLERECPALFPPCPTVHEIYVEWRIAQDTCP